MVVKSKAWISNGGEVKGLWINNGGEVKGLG